jgi:hypothetical protein
LLSIYAGALIGLFLAGLLGLDAIEATLGSDYYREKGGWYEILPKLGYRLHGARDGTWGFSYP